MSDAAGVNSNVPPGEQTVRAAPPGPAKPYGSHKRKILVFLVLFIAAMPMIAILSDFTTGVTYLLHGLLGAIVYVWCRYDAADLGKQIPWLIRIALIITPELGFPLYQVRVKRHPMGEAVSLTLFWMLLYTGIFLGSAYLLILLVDTLA